MNWPALLTRRNIYSIIYLCVKGIAHQKNLNVVIIYPRLCLYKEVCGYILYSLNKKKLNQNIYKKLKVDKKVQHQYKCTNI